MTTSDPDQTPDNDRLARQLEFLNELNKLKSVYRASRIEAGERFENSAEHSWHLAMYALILGEHANAAIDPQRVISMLLVHDIVEIDAGDVPLHGPADPLHEQKELAAAERLFNLLPADQATRLRGLWDEFEAAETEDAQFAKALDRLQPIVLNHQTGGGTWPQFNVSRSQVRKRTASIERGSAELWKLANKLFDNATRRGWLRDDS